jgi:hypothetical protein
VENTLSSVCQYVFRMSTLNLQPKSKIISKRERRRKIPVELDVPGIAQSPSTASGPNLVSILRYIYILCESNSTLKWEVEREPSEKLTEVLSKIKKSRMNI